jgi:hypothetical protein
MTKCPSTKNIKDYEIRYKKAKQEREKAELKCNFELILNKLIYF